VKLKFRLKKISSFGFGVLDDAMIGVRFSVILMTSSTDPTSLFRGAKFHRILGCNTSL